MDFIVSVHYEKEDKEMARAIDVAQCIFAEHKYIDVIAKQIKHSFTTN